MDKLREAFAAGRPSLGSWIMLTDTISAEIMGRAGFDWVILDTQHGGIGWDRLTAVLQALDLGATRALVRVGWNDPMQIMRALDLGALGVIVPMVSTPEQARTAAAASRYPPDGIRSFGPVRNPYLSESAKAETPLCFVMIETAEALDHLDAIAATPGVDGLFVGPVDLALSLGHGAALVMPDAVLAAIGDVVAACERHGKIAGCPAFGLPNAQALIERGVHFVAIGSDTGFIRRAAAGDLAQMRQWADTRA